MIEASLIRWPLHVRSGVRRLSLVAVLATLVGFAAASRASGLEPHPSEANGTTVCGEIEAGAHWVLSGSPYHVTCSAEVIEGAVLTIDPGVSIQFDIGTQLAIRGSLQSVGNAVQPITFTSAEAAPAPGDWHRIWFADEHSTSHMEHVVVEYAGLYGGAAIQVDKGWLTIRDSTVRNNANAGVSAAVMPTLVGNVLDNNGGPPIHLMLENGLGQPRTISGNVGSGNSIDGIRIWGLVDGDQTLGRNEGLPYYTDGELEVGAGHALTLEAGVVFKLDQGVLTIDGTLEALGEQGSEVVFTSLNDDTWDGDTNRNGGATLPVPGDWWFIHLSEGARLHLEHAAVLYAGRGDSSSVDAIGAELTITDSRIQYSLKDGLSIDDSSVVVVGSQFSDNGNDGIHFCSCNRPTSPVIEGNTFEDNGEFAIFFRTEKPTYSSPIIEGNTGSGNGVNGIYLDAILGSTVLKPNPDLPYVVQFLGTTPDATLTIDAGTIFKADRNLMDPGGAIIIEGSILVEGQEGNPVVFTSLKDDTYGGDTNGDGGASQAAPGDWVGIIVQRPLQSFSNMVYLPLVVHHVTAGSMPPGSFLQPGTGGSASTAATSSTLASSLNHAVIRYGGYNTANLTLSGGRVQILHSTVSHSQRWGIYAEDVALEMSNSLVADNGTYGLQLYGRQSQVSPILVGNTFSGNGTFAAYLIFNAGQGTGTDIRDNVAWDNGQVNGIYMEGYIDVGPCTWGHNPNMPYVIWAITVFESGRLTLEPGVELKFVAPTFGRGDGTLIIHGTVQAEGAADAPVAFTSFWDDSIGGDTDGSPAPPSPGDWIGLVVDGGQLILNNAIVRYAGSTGPNLWIADSTLEVRNSEISHSAGDGLGMNVLSEGAMPTLFVANTTFAGNSDYAVNIYSEVLAPIGFELEGNNASGNGVNGILINADLGTMTVKANPTLPYVIQGVTIASGETVSVEPGAVFKGSGILSVDGTLNVQGTAGNPVSFTSIHDDTVGGDTMGDGGGTLPSPGDWVGINVSDRGQANLDFATIRYAGSGAANLFSDGGQLFVSHSVITHSGNQGIESLSGGNLRVTNSLIAQNSGRGISNGGSATISYCDIVDNNDYGVYSWAGTMISAENNYWGSADGPSWDGNYCPSPPQGSGDFVSCHSVDYEPFATAPYH